MEVALIIICVLCLLGGILWLRQVLNKKKKGDDVEAEEYVRSIGLIFIGTVSLLFYFYSLN